MSDIGGLQDMQPWAWLGGAGLLGRLMYHARLVQQGKRKPISWALLWDIPIALGMGWIAFGIANYFKVEWVPTVSLSMVFSYLGPYIIDTVIIKVAEKRLGLDGTEAK